MWIQKIALKNYRNYLTNELEFFPGLNVFIGKNAQGKTNFLEAIYFLSLTRSHRTRSDKELIHFQEKELRVSGILQRSSGTVPLEINLSSKGRVTKVNHLKQAKLSDYIGVMTVVLFAPEDLQLIKGAPSLRRKFIDIDLGQIKPIYLSDLSNYNHVLKQRNTYLKTAEKVDINFLAVLDEQLADFGSRVKTLEKNRKRDIFKKNTGAGPHRDDLEFFINDMPANFGSQGQHRSLILSLKMAEIELIKNVTGDYPILLLDDVMSELDNYRQTELLKMIIAENVQTFITTTSLEHLSKLPEELKIFTVNQGTIEEN